jgi:hypothetical protein
MRREVHVRALCHAAKQTAAAYPRNQAPQFEAACLTKEVASRTFAMETTRPDADAELNYALRLVAQACQVNARTRMRTFTNEFHV